MSDVALLPSWTFACRMCGCTDHNPCLHPVTWEPCSWIEPDLCSACAGVQPRLVVVG